jgi:hypothetical protein
MPPVMLQGGDPAVVDSQLMATEESRDEFSVEVVELARGAAEKGQVRQTVIETISCEGEPADHPLGTPVRTEGRHWRVTSVGLAALVFEAPVDSFYDLILDLAPKMRERGCAVYGVGGHHWSLWEVASSDGESVGTSPSGPGAELAVIVRADDAYEPIRIERPGGADVSPHQFIRTLKEWSKLCSFEIVHAHPRFVDLVFRVLPQDLTSFAKSVFKLTTNAYTANYLGEPIEGWNDTDYTLAATDQTADDLAQNMQRTRRLHLFMD